MQVTADWRQHMSEGVFNDQFKGKLVFKGPGFYLGPADTMLVVPLPPNKPATIANVWHVKQPKDTIYDVHVYNVPFSETIFAASAAAPVRHDDRPFLKGEV